MRILDRCQLLTKFGLQGGYQAKSSIRVYPWLMFLRTSTQNQFEDLSHG